MIKDIVSHGTDTITIDFEKLFKRDLSQYSNFKIDKRSYHKKLPELIEEIKLYIEEEECLDYAYSILHFKFLIYKDPSILNKDFVLNYVKEKIFTDEKVMKLINEQVEMNYTLDIDSKENKNDKLQVTDELNKTYLKSSIMMRLLLPITCTISSILADNSELDEYIFELYTDTLIYFNNGSYEVIEKLYNIVSSRITTTRYSDKEIWERLQKQNIDICIIVRSFYNYLIVNNFLKISNNTSIIYYVDVILKNKVNFLFRLDYKCIHKSLDYSTIENGNSDNNSSEMDRLEAALLRKDRGLAYINRKAIQRKVNAIKKNILDNDEGNIFTYFIESIKINNHAKLFIDMFYNKEFNIIYNGVDEYYLLYHLIKELKKRKFELLPVILTSKETATRINNKKKILEKLSESIKYKLVIKKYKNIQNLVNIDINFVANLIIKLKSGQYINLMDGKEIEINLDILNEEVLDFLFLLPSKGRR